MSSNPLSLTAIALFLDAGLQVLDVKNQALGAILLIIVAFLIFYTITDWLQLPKRFRKQLPAFKELTFGANIPLPKAAQIAYEEARLSGSVWALAAERLNTKKTPDGILDYLATYIGGKTRIFGKRPPSTRLEEIPIEEIKSGNFQHGAAMLKLRDQSNTVYTDLQVPKKEFDAIVTAIKEGLKTDSPI